MNRKIIIRGVLSLIVIMVLIVAGLGIRIKLEQTKMTPAQTMKINEEIIAINDGEFVNMYLISTEEGYIAIDAGNSLTSVSESLESLGIKTHEISAVFLTHTDSDHVGAIELFKEADIYINSLEEQMVNGETARFLFIHNQLKLPYKLVEDGSLISIGNLTIKCISIPGHTPGSMSYLINNKYLFTGDAIGFDGSYVTPFNELFNMDGQQALLSTKKIMVPLENIEHIFTGHHGTFEYSDTIYESILTE